MYTDAAITIGLAVGAGTGLELSEVFKKTILQLSQLYHVNLRIEQSPRLYQTFHSLKKEHNLSRVIQITREDSDHYLDFCRQMVKRGTSAIFRTAMNAQSLYLVRQNLCAVKVEYLCNKTTDLLMIRDQAQGFYTGDNAEDLDLHNVVRQCRFSKETTNLVMGFALDEAHRRWGNIPIDRIMMAYKFHLLDARFRTWVEEFCHDRGIAIELCQPDTANRNLIRDDLTGHILIIGANEWADIMHAVLLSWFQLGPQEDRYTYNVFLHPEMKQLREYQTVHGSADDIAGKNLVNPFATIRAAAAIVECHAGCKGAARRVERILHEAAEKGIVTSDLNGEHSTASVVDFVSDCLSVAV